MAPNPKKKHSKRRQGGTWANYKLRPMTLAECPQCHSAKLPHRVCRSCGYYNGREVLPVETSGGE